MRYSPFFCSSFFLYRNRVVSASDLHLPVDVDVTYPVRSDAYPAGYSRERSGAKHRGKQADRISFCDMICGLETNADAVYLHVCSAADHLNGGCLKQATTHLRI